MPTGTPFKSFIPPFPIRVDDFAYSDDIDQPAQLHLLSHTHSDHITGLTAKSFASTVICSYDAKEMLLRHEVYSERVLKELEVRAENVRTFQHLKVQPRKSQDGTVYYHGSRDLLKPLPLNTPTQWELSNDSQVTVTLFDANHCPGAVMFLIEGQQGAVLHTGDFRAEPWFLEALTRNPLIQRYLAPLESFANTTSNAVTSTLDAIYLDTACLLSEISVPSKDEACNGLIELMAMLPSDTLFFINSWTWGYEDILKAIASAFNTQIHVDRYKHSIYTHLQSEPFLRSIVTTDPTSTRFHACERFHRCDEVAVEGREAYTKKGGRHVVYVNPVTMGKEKWREYMRETNAILGRGEIVDNLLVALSRHSPLPELRAFVSLFKPKRVVPNTLDPNLGGLDYACLDKMFEGCLQSSSAFAKANIPLRPPVRSTSLSSRDLQADGDVTFKNLEGGGGAAKLAEKWAEDSGRLRKKLEVMRRYLTGKEREIAERLLSGRGGEKGKEKAWSYEDVEMVNEESQVEDVWRSHSRPNSSTSKPLPPNKPETAQKPKLSRHPKPIAATDTTRISLSLPAPNSASSTTSPQQPTPIYRGIQGKASMEETERAIARLRAAAPKCPSSRSFKVPSVYLRKDSDEDTDDSDAEAAREKTMRHLFAPLVGIDPGPLDSGRSSSPFPGTSHQEEEEQQEKKANKEVEMERPHTPKNKNKPLQDPSEPITPLSQSRFAHHGRRQDPIRKDKDLRPTSKAKLRKDPELGSPIQLHAPPNDPEPSSLEQQRLDEGPVPGSSSIPRTSKPKSELQSTLPDKTIIAPRAKLSSRSGLEVPFIDLRNTRSGPGFSEVQPSLTKRRADTNISDPQSPNTKRRKLTVEPTMPLPTPQSQGQVAPQKSMPQARASTPSVSFSAKVPILASIASSSSLHPLPPDRRTAPMRDERQALARKLSMAIPPNQLSFVFAQQQKMREWERPVGLGVSVTPSTSTSASFVASASVSRRSSSAVPGVPSLSSSSSVSFSSTTFKSKSGVMVRLPMMRMKTLDSAVDDNSDVSSMSSSIWERRKRLERVPDDLFVQCESDKRMDPERVRRLADEFRAEIEKGKRPGEVVPRLSCIGSQEESQPEGW